MSNDHDGFLPVFMQHQTSIYRFIMSLVPQADEAEDILQQVSVTLWRNWDSYDPERGKFLNWAIGVARNHVRNHIRQRATRNQHVVFDEGLVEQLASTRANMDDFDQRRDALNACLQRLSAQARSLVESYYGRTVSVSEMARSYGLTARSLFRQVSGIRHALLDCITRRLEKTADL